MKVFLSWSGSLSKAVALAFKKELIEQINLGVTTFISDEDIPSGKLGMAVLSEELGDTSFGIIFTTRSNVQTPWIHFEAGALAKGIGDKARVAPILIDLDPSELSGPLQQLQAVECTQQKVTKLLLEVRSLSEGTGTEEAVRKGIKHNWPRFNRILAKELSNKAHARRETPIQEVLRHTKLLVEAQRQPTLGNIRENAQYSLKKLAEMEVALDELVPSRKLQRAIYVRVTRAIAIDIASLGEPMQLKIYTPKGVTSRGGTRADHLEAIERAVDATGFAIEWLRATDAVKDALRPYVDLEVENILF